MILRETTRVRESVPYIFLSELVGVPLGDRASLRGQFPKRC
jgi:hypothetical protein